VGRIVSGKRKSYSAIKDTAHRSKWSIVKLEDEINSVYNYRSRISDWSPAQGFRYIAEFDTAFLASSTEITIDLERLGELVAIVTESENKIRSIRNNVNRSAGENRLKSRIVIAEITFLYDCRTSVPSVV